MQRISIISLVLMIILGSGGLACAAVLLETGFEGSTNLPSGWTQEQITTSVATWKIQAGGYTGGYSPSSAHSGNRNATLYVTNTNTNKTRLISPVFWTAVYTNLTLNFWHTQAEWTDYSDQDELKVFYSTDGGANWSELAHYTANISSWTERTITLPVASASSRIAFEGNAMYGFGVCVDDIQVTGDPTAALPEFSVSATDALASESGTNGGVWTISRSGSTNGVATVDFNLSGTATDGSDYSLDYTNSVTFSAGLTSVVVTLTVVDDAVYDELNETATLTLESGAGYEIGVASDTVTIADNDVSDLQILIVGSTHDSSEEFGGTSAAFSPVGIATQLESILSGPSAGLGSVNVKTLERYATTMSPLGQTHYAFNLASWFHWPYPNGADSSRWADLRGEAGTEWDYVILIPDPYTIEKMPGLYALGVSGIANEIAKGPAETILLMSWPNGTGSSIAHYEEMVYRTGNSGGYTVAPAGLAWDTEGQPSGNDAAYLAAATIYSAMYGLNAKDAGYNYNSSLADTAYSTVIAKIGAKPYSGPITFQNPFLFNTDTERKIYWSSRGTSTEAGFNANLGGVLGRCKVGYESYTPWNRTEADWAANGGDEPWTMWPTNWPTPIAWNLGRDHITSEWYKSYLINPTYWTFAYPYYRQWNTWSYSVNDANDHFIGQMFGNDFDMAKRMITEGNSGRGLPLRTMWARFHKLFPLERPMRDSSPHFNTKMDEAAGTYMYTLYSGRCPMDVKPTDVNTTWEARRVGYETAWMLGRCQTRAPGFKVTPTAWNATNVTPTTTQTLSVQFIFAPTSEVTVAVSTGDNDVGRVALSTLTFTPGNYAEAQTVRVSGVSGTTGGNFPFDVTLATTSDDEVYDGLSDSWDFMNTRNAETPPTYIRILGSGQTIASGDATPSIADSTDYGVVDVAVTNTFVVENMSSSVAIDLTGEPRVVLSSNPSGYFSVFQDAATSVAPDNSTIFRIAYNPGAPGTHTAVVLVESDDAVIPSYSFTISATRASAPVAGSALAASVGATGATFSGSLASGEQANAWICWGENDGGTNTVGSWEHAISIGSVLESGAFETSVSNLFYGIAYECRIYVTNAYGDDWSDPVSFSIAMPSDTESRNWDFETGDLQGWTNVGTTVGDDTIFRDGNNPSDMAQLSGRQGYHYISTYDGESGSDVWTGIIQSEEVVLGAGAHWTMVTGGGMFSWSGIPDAPGQLAGVALERQVSPGVWENVVFQAGTENLSLIAKDHDLSAYEGDTVRVRIYDTTQASWGWTAVDDISLTAVYVGDPLTISNDDVQNADTNSAQISGTVSVRQAVGDVHLYYSQTSNETASAWTSDPGAQSILVGSYTNVSNQAVSYTLESLPQATTYYCTFMLTNDVTNIWASPCLTFNSLGTNSYTLEYLAGENGSISGVATQTVVEMSSGTPVTAVGDLGYRFDRWSDESTQNPRTDTSVKSNITVTATFVVDPPAVTNRGAIPSNTTRAVISGELIGGGVAHAWICWGDNDGGAASTGMWDHVVSVGTVTQGLSFATLAAPLNTNAVYWYRCYVTNGDGSAWSQAPSIFSGTPIADIVGFSSPVLLGGFDGNQTMNSVGGVDELVGAKQSAESVGRVSTRIWTDQPTEKEFQWSSSDQSTTDGQWGLSTFTPAASTVNDMWVITQQAASWVNYEVHNSGGEDLSLNKFHVSAKRTASGAPTTLTVSLEQNGTFADPPVLTASDLTATGSKDIALDSGTGWVDYEFALADILSDLILGPGEKATFRIVNSAGTARLYIDNIAISGSFPGPAPIVNDSPVDLTSTSAVLRASINAMGTNYTVRAHWGTSNGETNAIAWVSADDAGSWTNCATNVSVVANGLNAGQTYYYTFSASNAEGVVWASPSWLFVTAGMGTGTTYTLQYFSGQHGTIMGFSSQLVFEGNSGSPVTAVPDSGYRFDQWSDGNTQNPRTDTGGTNDISVTASFVLDPLIVVNNGGSPSNTTSCVLSGQLTGGGSGVALICWGDNDAGPSGTSNWDHVVSVGSVSQGVAFSALATPLSTNATYWYRCYVTNGGVSVWSASAESFSGTANTVSAGSGEVVLLGGYDGNQTQNAVAPASPTSNSGVRELVNARQGAEAVGLVATRLWTDQTTNKEFQWGATSQSTTDGQWGFSTFAPTASTANDPWVITQEQASWINFEVTNTGTVDIALSKFHISANRTGTGASTTLTVSLQQNGTFEAPPVLSGSDLTATGSWDIALDAGTGWYDYEFSFSDILSDLTLGAGEKATFRIANSTGTARLYLDNIAISGGATDSGGVIVNESPSNVTLASAVLNASLDASGTNYAVYAHWGTSDGGTNASAWGRSVSLGGWTNISTNVSCTVNGLFRGQTYYYTFRASNDAGDVWASPSWTFATPAGDLMTTNHLIPYTWIDTTATNVVTDHESEIMDDPDGDGFTTWQEYWSGTDPNVADSHLKIDRVHFDGANVEIEWQHAHVSAGIPPVTVLATTNLSSGPWFRVGEKSPADGTNVWTDLSPDRCFYKLAVTNAP
jgi:hypothetical protein